MTHSGHGQEVCQYGIVHSQCRCIDGNRQGTLIDCDRPMQHALMKEIETTAKALEKTKTFEELVRELYKKDPRTTVAEALVEWSIYRENLQLPKERQ